MADRDDGGPAFPRAPHTGYETDDGMSLRDYFAAAAMQAIVGTYRTARRFQDIGVFVTSTFCNRDMLIDEGVGCAEVAQDAYAIADAMLAARKT